MEKKGSFPIPDLRKTWQWAIQRRLWRALIFLTTNIAGDKHVLSFSLRIYHLPAPALRYSTRASRFPFPEIFNWEVNRSRSPLFKLFICFKASHSTFAHTHWFEWVPPTERRMDHPPLHTPLPLPHRPHSTHTTPPDKLVTWFIK